MPLKLRHKTKALPRRLMDLVRLLPPQAIVDDTHCENTIEMIDRIMGAGTLTKDQESYLETLVQLVQFYESAHHAMDMSDLSGLDVLRHLMDENGMTASDLARLLGVHPSMGSKILMGERSLTIEHIKKLCARIKLSPDVFLSSRISARPGDSLH